MTPSDLAAFSIIPVSFWLLFCLCAAFLANKRNRSGVLWFFLSLIITPLVSIIMLLCMKEGGARKISPPYLRDMPRYDNDDFTKPNFR